MKMSRNEVPITAKPVKTWQLVKGFIDGLAGLQDVRFEELITVPTIAGSYANIGDGKAKRLGNTSTWYVGYAPVFEDAASPIAFDVCFHTSSMGIVPMLRIGALESLDPELVDEINELKRKANLAIAQRLEECACNDILIRYQWYACLLEHLGIPIKPGDAREKAAAVIDTASDEAGVCVRGKYGINTDDSSVAIKVLDHLGFIFNAPRKMTPTYSFDLNAYSVTLLKDGTHYRVVVSHDLGPYLTGSKAEILTEHNGAGSHFRPVFAANAQAAGELFLKQLGLPAQTSILTDEDPAEELPNDQFGDIPEVELEVAPEVEPEIVPLQTGRRVPSSGRDSEEEHEARQYLRQQGYRLIEEGSVLLLVREVTRVGDVLEAADIVEEEEALLYNLPGGDDGYLEQPQPQWNAYPPQPQPSTSPRPAKKDFSDLGQQRRVLHPRNSDPDIRRRPQRPSRPSRPPRQSDQADQLETEAVIEIGRDRNSGAYTARFEGEIIAEGRRFDGVQQQVSELIAQHPDFRKAKVMYRTAEGTLVPSRPRGG